MTAVVEPPRFMDEWSSRQAGLQQTQPAIPTVVRGPRPRYVQAALDGETQAVREAPKGTRNGQLNTSSLKLGRLVGARLLDAEVAAGALRDAALAAGLPPLETDRTIASGMRAGIADPRDPGEEQNGRPLRELPMPGEEGPGAAAASPGIGPPIMDLDAYLQPAGTFLLGMPDKPEPLWGVGDIVLWSHGESLMIAGGPGLGKTTLAGQLVRARIGFQSNVLDMPVQEGRRVLYLMMDRPQQIARRLLQQFTAPELGRLDERMQLGVGPPPKDLARNPDLLPELCARAGADTVVIDSLKDAAIGLTDDEVGAGWNRARQLTVAAGVQMLELHHLVKRGANGKDPDTLADVYGSAWLTAGVGSCLVLLGDAGSPLVKVKHLKPVAEPFGPASLSHDHERGVTTVHHKIDLLELVAVTGVQTARSAAVRLFEKEKPEPGEVEHVRRRLESLVAGGKLHRRTGGIEISYHPLHARSLQELRTDVPVAPAADLTLEGI